MEIRQVLFPEQTCISTSDYVSGNLLKSAQLDGQVYNRAGSSTRTSNQSHDLGQVFGEAWHIQHLLRPHLKLKGLIHAWLWGPWTILAHLHLHPYWALCYEGPELKSSGRNWVMDASYTHGHTYRPNIIPITIKIDNSPNPITMMVIKILPRLGVQSNFPGWTWTVCITKQYFQELMEQFGLLKRSLLGWIWTSVRSRSQCKDPDPGLDPVIFNLL